MQSHAHTWGGNTSLSCGGLTWELCVTLQVWSCEQFGVGESLSRFLAVFSQKDCLIFSGESLGFRGLGARRVSSE